MLCPLLRRLKLEQYFKNYQTCLSMCTVLQKTGYPHTLTPIEVDNQCAVSILANTVRQRLSKSIYIRFFWARDRIRQDQFCVYWRPDKNDRADYFNKYHAPLRYKEMCSIYLVILLSNWTYYHKATQMIYRLIDVIMFVVRVC